jgi:iron complex outermembrane recepter protein
MSENNNSNAPVRTVLGLAIALASASSGVTAEESFALEEIVVTAQKRAQSLQDVPISVAAMDGDKMAEAGIENLQDLSAYVPSLKIVDGGLVPQMYIRGIGSGSNQGFEQSVGTYSDGVYAGRSLQSRAAFMDLERVEVLRGPQSILFGQSSIAGAISLISAKPSDEFEGMVSASYAPDFDESEINAVVSGPLTDNLGARLAIRDRQEDGYMDNKFRNEDGPALDEQAARLTLAWDVTPDLSATFKAEVARMDREGRSLKPIDLGAYPALTAGVGTYGAMTQTTAQLDHDMWANEDNKMSFDSDSYVLNLEYALGDHTLTSVTAYSEYDYQEDNYDGDTTEVGVVSMDMQEDFDQFSQEIRLASPGGETIDYIVGAFYQTSEQKYQEDATLNVSTIGLDALAGFPVGALDSLVVRPFSQESETLSAFGQATWNISEALRLTLGLRYTRDEKEGERAQTTTSSITGLPHGALVTAALAEHAAANGFQLADHNLKGDYSESNWTPSVNLQYDLNEDIMLYVSYSEGFKAAGYDARGTNGFTAGDTGPLSGLPYGDSALGADNFFYDQEEAKTYELGAKMTLLDGAAELNLALYQTDYSDMQVSVFDGSFGFAVDNAGEATVRGLEMDGRWRATESLTLTGSLGYLDFEWEKYENGSCPAVGSQPLNVPGNPKANCDYKGYENINTPEWTLSLGAQHVYALSDALELRSALDANFKDNHYTSGDLDERSEQAATTLFNGRIAIAATDDSWQVALTGKNLTDKEVMTYAAKIPQSQSGLAAEVLRPRTFAIEGIYKF